MPRRTTPKPLRLYLIATAVLASLLALPAVGAASGNGSGGAGVRPSGEAQSGNRTVSATGHGITLTTRASGFYERKMKFSGSAGRGHAGRVVEIQRLSGGSWVSIATSTVTSTGSFSAQWKVDQSGSRAFRAILARHSSAQAASTWPTVKVVLYRFSIATIYGPGMWGNHTACGEILHRKTLGVANRTLPCGTHVSLYYHGRTIVVPVIDRGPYANHANWDLTEATSQALGMDETAQVGAATVSH